MGSFPVKNALSQKTDAYPSQYMSVLFGRRIPPIIYDFLEQDGISFRDNVPRYDNQLDVHRVHADLVKTSMLFITVLGPTRALLVGHLATGSA